MIHIYFNDIIFFLVKNSRAVSLKAVTKDSFSNTHGKLSTHRDCIVPEQGNSEIWGKVSSTI